MSEELEKSCLYLINEVEKLKIDPVSPTIKSEEKSDLSFNSGLGCYYGK